MWHDVECGGYQADLPLWLELAAAAGGPVLDVGAGTGRVALRLAAAGHAVTALDRDGELLATLAERTRGLPVETVVADASSFSLPGREFALIAVPMQTIQLVADRDGFFRSARAALAPGGLVALAIADTLEPFEGAFPAPDVGEDGGWRYVSQPTAVRPVEGAMRIERRRELVAPDGERRTDGDVVELALVSAAELEAEGARHGLAAEPERTLAPTDEHVGSTVVLLRG
jgi:SAM-dependent methyltransferase